MTTVNYQSPSAFLFLHHQISVKDSNSIIEIWLKNHPQESRATLSKLLESKKVLVKQHKLIDLPQLSLAEATQLAQEIQRSGKLDVKERQYQLKHYPSCFIGSELVDYLITNHDFLVEEAISVGQSLLGHGLIQHVVDEHEFKNDFLFYRFQLESSQFSAAEAEALLAEIKQNNVVEVKDRWHQLKKYKQCFLGTDLVDYLTKSKEISVQEAISLGQGLIDYKLVQHVLEQHDFKNEALFYKFK